jgi:hypothetical protein
MTDIRFMDQITAPRRSLHPFAAQQLAPARDASEIGLSECVVALAQDLPQLELYAEVSDDLAAWIDKSKERYQQDEDEAAKVTPELFHEFMEADESGKAELMVSFFFFLLRIVVEELGQHQLKLIKVNMHLQVKSEWYEWKRQWVEQLIETADKTLESLETVRDLVTYKGNKSVDVKRRRPGSQGLERDRRDRSGQASRAQRRACPGDAGARARAGGRCRARELRSGVSERAQG